MRFRLRHYTHYTYQAPVKQAHNQVRMLLREAPNQHCHQRSLRIRPTPAWGKLQADFFGNKLLYLELNTPHRDSRIFVQHIVDVDPPPSCDPTQTPAWDQLATTLEAAESAETRDLALYRLGSRMAPHLDPALALAAPHFQPGRPVLEAALALAEDIYKNFRFDPHVTTIATPVAEVLKKRGGVCQDFAHLMLSALRSLGLASRYVSGYIETLPPPGKPRLVGADASHAWISLWCGPQLGWQDIDPTNNLRPHDAHLTAAWGRDYDDVIPLNGVISGGGRSSKLKVRVDVQRLESPSATRLGE